MKDKVATWYSLKNCKATAGVGRLAEDLELHRQPPILLFRRGQQLTKLQNSHLCCVWQGHDHRQRFNGAESGDGQVEI